GPMARANLLTVKEVNAITKPGRYTDGDGLYLRVTDDSKRWVFRYTAPDGKRKDMGFGNAGTNGVSLAEARAKKADARKLLDQGIDPSQARREARAPKAEVPIFGTFADTFVENIVSEFRNAKHHAQWKMTLSDTYCKSL